MATEIQKQRDYIRRMREEQLPCPRCGLMFAEAEVDGGDGRPSVCPCCGLHLLRKIALLGGEQFWARTR